MPLPVMLIAALVIMLAPLVKNVMEILVYVVMETPYPPYLQTPKIVAIAATRAPLIKNVWEVPVSARMELH